MNQVFNSYKIRYTMLNELFNASDISFSKKRNVNIFINLDWVFKNLFTDFRDKTIRASEPKVLYEPVSNIVNIAAHYRQYFNKNKIYSRVILYSSNLTTFSKMRNRMFINNYRENYNRSIGKPDLLFIRKLLLEAIPLAKIILEYIDDVYYITTDELEPSVIPSIIYDKFSPDDINLLVTKDKYEYQYVNNGFYILRPKKELSYLITKDNLFDIICEENKVKYEKYDKELNTNFYSFIYSISGDMTRNIPKIKNIGPVRAMKLLREGIDKGLITNDDKMNIVLLLNVISPEYREIIYKNYNVTDIGTQLNIPSSVLINIESQLVNRFDNPSLKRINDEYFENHPLMLIELTDAYYYKNKNQNKIKLF